MNRIDRMIDTASHLDAAARMHSESAQSRPAVGQTGNFLDAVAQQAAGVTGLSAAEEAAQTQPVSLESMLRAKYPGLVYHVFDAGSSYWRSRNDYPHYLLYQEDLDTEALENWRPSGPNPAYEESSAIRKLGSIPAGKTAVVIHPAVQERMEREPEYAKEILSRIDAWFTFDILRNEAIMPGITARSSRCIAIGEDGSIANVQAFSHPRITCSGSGPDDEEPDFWELRLSRHIYFMELWKKKQIAHSLLASQPSAAVGASQAAKLQLAQLMNGEGLAERLGDTIAGVSVESVFASTRAEVWGVQLPG